jgi:patatin-like phospholipase/acyl hydrolase
LICSSSSFIAIALGSTNFTLSKCIREFPILCEEAFTGRELHNIPVLKQASISYHGSIYKTQPLYKALKKTLGDRPFFGGQREDNPKYLTKVALTSTDQAGNRNIVIANYCRQDNSKAGQVSTSTYDFPRPNNPKQELTFWEAAAASSAATPYFKPFFHAQSGRYFLDGSLNSNNPAKILHQERRLIWSDIADRAPDIFLSIGTGQNRDDMTSKMEDIPNRSKLHKRSVSSRNL